jgi:phosphate-selective porin OprO/OprP
MFIWSKKRTRRKRLTSLALAGSLLALPATSSAASPTARERELEERVRRLERIIEQSGIGKKGAAAAPTEAPLEKSDVEAIVDTKIKQQKVLAGWKDGFYLESPSGDFKLKLRGFIQTDARFFPLEGGDTGTDSIFLRRVRPSIEGTVYKHFDYKIVPDFADGQVSLQDAYADVTYFKPWTSLRAGKFKVPFSLERLQSGADLLFIERSIAQNIGQNRDVGFQLGGDLIDGALSYQVGYFNGANDGRSVDGDVTSDKEAAARIFSHPFKNTDIAPLKNVGLGIAGTFGNNKKGESQANVRYNTAGRSAFFRYATSDDVDIRADGERMRFAPQAYYFWGPFGFMGEYVWNRQGLRKENDETGIVVHDTFTNTGWFAQASWVLTGEDASYRGVKPVNPFDPYNGRWGAFEVAVRGSNLDIDKELFKENFAKKPNATTGAWNYGFGINWYLNNNFKLQANWERTEFDNEVNFGGNLRDHEDVVITRFQISY